MQIHGDHHILIIQRCIAYTKNVKNTYIELLNLYIKKQPNKKLKYLYTCTTCIKNKYGSELVKYNGHKK